MVRILRASSKSISFLTLFLLPLLAVLLYGHTFKSPFHFDDKDLIKNNPAIHDLYDPERAMAYNRPRPALMVSLAFSYHFSGTNVFGYHLFNILLHCLSSIIIFCVSRLLLHSSGKKGRLHAAFLGASSLGAMFFLVHPMNTEAVTYISARSDLLAAFFLLLSFYFFFKARICPGAALKSAYMVAAFLAYCLSMASKEIGVVLPILVLGADYYLFRSPENENHGRPSGFIEYLKIRGPALLPFFLMVLVLFVVRYQWEGSFLEKKSAFLSMHSRAAYVLTQVNVIPWYYINRMFFPENQNVDIYFPIYKTFFNLSTAAGAICLSGMVFLAVRRRFSSALLSFAVFWFVASLSPTSSFIPITDVAVERRLYLPGIAMSFMVAHIMSGPGLRKSITPLVVLLLFCSLGINRNYVYRDELSLWTDAASKAKANERARNNLGDVYNGLGLYEEAAAELREAVRIEPRYAEAHYNLGVVYGRMGRRQEALRELRLSEVHHYSSPELYYNLGVLYEETGLLDKAEEKYLIAVKLNPGHSRAYNNLGNIHARQGRLEEAAAEWKAVLRIDPDFNGVRERLEKISMITANDKEHSLAN
ncbi:MAG: tetratricopeptide repeat protein [Nitrospinae bacterium]|nr:tetratricopeptide repeat protein [Nitrospinota bacterium]